MLLSLAAACRRPPARPSEPPAPDAPPPPQVSGTLTVPGLTARVTVTRDKWGIPHIVAQNQDDLFFAQGFVQAQDRLFQMDLWRRSVQGRLSEVMGSNFIERDAMTRRMQFRGNLEQEWASYGPDARAIATAFTRGINAWVTAVREHPPEEFALAGWAPEPWTPEDLLNRTDAFLSGRGADDELFRARLASLLGPVAAARLSGALELPAPTSSVDLSAINFFIGDMLRRVGTTPFFSGLFADVPGKLRDPVAPSAKPLPLPVPPTAGLGFAVGPARSASGAPILAGAAAANAEAPATRYLVHLQAPGWNVIGATAPWRPGVAIGHNERIAWSFSPAPLDTQDIFVEKLNPANPHQVMAANGAWREMTIEMESVAVKGRKAPYDYEKQYTPHGIVIALDRERNLAYTLRWTGAETGAAPELAALAVVRAGSWPEFRSALSRWKMPAAEFVYADVDGHVGSATAGAVPVRPSGRGGLPSAGWTSEAEWRGLQAADRLPALLDPREAAVASAPGSGARLQRTMELLLSRQTPVAPGVAPASEPTSHTVDTARGLLRDVRAWNANQLVPLLAPLKAPDPVVESARQRLLAWNREVRVDSPDALLYVVWEHALLRRLGSLRIPSALLDEFVAKADRVLVPAITAPTALWFDGDAARSRDALLLDSLTAAIDDERRWTSADAAAVWGQYQVLTFRHPLAVNDRARRRYDTGPFAVAGYHSTLFATVRATAERTVAPALEVAFDVKNWDASLAVVAPGQSAAPDSPHFADLAPLWLRGAAAPLRFSEVGINDAAESRLTLIPQ